MSTPTPCCATPTLTVVRSLIRSSHYDVDLCRCDGCGQHWLKTSEEFIDWKDGNDTWVDNYEALSAEEAQARIAAL